MKPARALDLQAAYPQDRAQALLCAVCYGEPDGEVGTLNVGLPVLPRGGRARTVWCAPGPFVAGQIGPLAYRHNQHLLFGRLSLREEDFAAPDVASALQQASRAAYGSVFEALQLTGFAHLVRCWNYLPRINADGGGLERYRQFNIGRQEAFLAGGRAWQAGAPSACALGSASGDLVVYFLASRAQPHAIENPRQMSAWRYPERYGPRAPTFSRGCLLTLPGEEVLFISGTASIVGHESLHAGDIVAQTEETLRNIETVVAEANRQARSGGFLPRELALKAFIRHAEDMPAVARVLADTFGDDLDVIYVQADICRAELLVEIEAVGFRDEVRP